MAKYKPIDIYYIEKNDTLSSIHGPIELTNGKVKFEFEDKGCGPAAIYKISVTSIDAMNFNGKITQTNGNWKGNASIILYKSKNKDKIILQITNKCTGGSTSWTIAAKKI
jgi:hypothetical protein